MSNLDKTTPPEIPPETAADLLALDRQSTKSAGGGERKRSIDRKGYVCISVLNTVDA